MIKAHKKSKTPLMRRACRVYLNDLNAGKVETLTGFLQLCHDATQHAVDLFWQRQDLSAALADLPTVRQIRDRFGLTTRLAQALAKQAKETIRSARSNGYQRKPRLRRHTVTLYYHFVTIEPFHGSGFNWAVRLTGSGAPRMTIPVHSTCLINEYLTNGWQMSRTIRLGRRGNRLWIDFLLEKERPPLRQTGRVVGMDSNYKAGLVFSDGQVVGQGIYERIQTFSERQKNTHAEIDSLIGQALNPVDWSNVKVLAIENLKNVKKGKRGTFSRTFNRRLSHWLYASTVKRLEQICEENGIRLERKSPWKTSQFCRFCGKWDRRNRVGDRFLCVNCGHADHADHNSAKNLELLGVAGVYGLRSLKAIDFVQISKV
jgi:IS605 OrfB family transposase